jgi:hypothetical protein
VKVIDGSEVRKVSVRFTHQSDPLKTFESELKNDGLNGDISQDDNVFSFIIPVRGFGFYSAEVSATDFFGNNASFKEKSILVVH